MDLVLLYVIQKSCLLRYALQHFFFYFQFLLPSNEGGWVNIQIFTKFLFLMFKKILISICIRLEAILISLKTPFPVWDEVKD